MSEEVQHGLEGVLVAETELSDIDGEAGRLVYRGYPIEDLAEAVTFEETLFPGDDPGGSKRRARRIDGPDEVV